MKTDKVTGCNPNKYHQRGRKIIQSTKNNIWVGYVKDVLHDSINIYEMFDNEPEALKWLDVDPLSPSYQSYWAKRGM
jgi:hypothetical protein